MDFPYVMKTTSLKEFLTHIITAGIPDAATVTYLRQAGFRSSNDNPILKVIKFIDFADSAGRPTEKWKLYRDKNQSKAILGEAIKNAYADLFKTYPDADRKDNEAIRNYFSAHTKVAEKTLSAMVGTFKAMCELGDFSDSCISGTQASDSSDSTLPIPTAVAQSVGFKNGVVLNINIQLQLPETKDSAVFDKFFESMKKNLLSN